VIRTLRFKATSISLSCVWCIATGCALAGQADARSSTGSPWNDADLVLWLDASDPIADQRSGADDRPLSVWKDKSRHHHDARQAVESERPIWTRHSNDGAGGFASVRFRASDRRHLVIPHTSALDLPMMTAFVVARAEPSGSDAWLFSKNVWADRWTGYGIALDAGRLAPWPHLGLETGQRGYFHFDGDLRGGFRLVEIVFDGQSLVGTLDGATDSEQACVGRVANNTAPLTVGTLGGQFLEGDIAELLLYGRPLNATERGRTRRYLMAKYALDHHVARPGESALVADWLFQAERRPLLERAAREIGWARELAARLAASSHPPNLADHLARLDRLAADADRMRSGGTEPDAARSLYLAVREVKRAIALANPAVDFTRILCIDQPLPQGSESTHEAVHRLGRMAVPGGRLVMTDGLEPGAPGRSLLSDREGAFWRPDLSFDAKRVLYGFKANDESSFHIHELDLATGQSRQLTWGDYDDIDPIHLPDGHILFTTTRGNTYVRCGPYIYSNALARCDSDGGNVYLISVNSEPDFVPALMGDGRVVYSRWEYSDKDQNRVQSLWTTRQDGTHTSVLWGNQSVWPDHPAEPRPMPDGRRVMFTAVGHHDWFHGSIGIVDPTRGSNYPHGLTRVTWDLPWPEVGIDPINRPESSSYHSSGRFTGYLGPYPISNEDFLVSARGAGDKFRVYWMDIHGNRELLFEGAHQAWYAIPVKPRSIPPRHADRVAWPGTGSERREASSAVFYNVDVCEGVPDLPRERVKFLRVFQQDAKTYSTWDKVFAFSGPAVSAVQTEAVKRIVSTVPVEADGSVYFEVPSGKALFFQLLDEHQRAVHTMRSFTGVLPGERQTCVGCHESRHGAPPNRVGIALGRPPTPITPPPWGDESIGYERFAQRALDRHCGRCHQGDGSARHRFDATLRPAAEPFGLFKEPYLTLIGGAAWPIPVPDPDRPGYGIAGAIPVYGLRPDDVYPQDDSTDGSSTIQRSLRPLRYLSARSRLVAFAMNGEHYGVAMEGEDLLRLIAWIDANGPFLGEEEIRAMDDPTFSGIERLPIRPRLRSAPVVSRP